MNITDIYYLINGKRYTRVSAVLSYCSRDYDRVPEHYMEEARALGQQIHSYFDFINKELSFEIPEHLQNHIHNYDSWLHANVAKVIGSEMIVRSDKYRFAGRADLVAMINDTDLALIDIKTTAGKLKSHKAQTAAYTMALKEMGYNIRRRMILYIDKNTGEVNPIKLTSIQHDTNGWQSALSWYRYNKAA